MTLVIFAYASKQINLGDTMIIGMVYLGFSLLLSKISEKDEDLK